MVGRERIRKFAGLGAALLTMVGAITLATRVDVAPVGERSPAELWDREAGGERGGARFPACRWRSSRIGVRPTGRCGTSLTVPALAYS